MTSHKNLDYKFKNINYKKGFKIIILQETKIDYQMNHTRVICNFDIDSVITI